MRYETRDWVIMAALAAVSAVAYVLLAYVWTALTAAFGPLGGAFIGLFQFGHLLAFAILRKPGVALITSILTTVGQLLLGDPAGAYVLGWGVVHGLGAEAVFLAIRYKEPGWWALMAAGGLAACLGHFYTYAVFGWEASQQLFWISLPIVFLMSATQSGGVAYLANLQFAQVFRRRGA